MKELTKRIANVLGQILPIIIIMVVITPFVIVENLFFPFITGKTFYFRILVEIAALLYIVLAIIDKSVRPKFSPVAAASVLFLSVLSLATVFAVDSQKSFWSNYERMEGLILFLHLFVYFLIAGSVLKIKNSSWKWFFNASLIVSVFVGVDAFIDFYSQTNVVGYRISGNLGNSSYLGIYSLIHIFISLFFVLKTFGKKSLLILKKDGTWVPIGFYAFVGIFNLIVMFNTGTRGSFVGLVVGLFVTTILIAVFEKKNVIVRKIGIALIILSVLFVALLGVAKDSDFVKKSDMFSRFAELVTLNPAKVLETQGKARSLLWGIAWDGIKERPVFGWGLDNFHYVYAKHYKPEMYAQEQWFDRSHNVFMDWMVQTGFAGLLTYLSLFGGAIYIVWRKKDDEIDTTIIEHGSHESRLMSSAQKSLLTEKNSLSNSVHQVSKKYQLITGSLSVSEVAVIIGGLIAYLGHNFFIFDNLASYILFFSVLAFVHQYYICEKVQRIEDSKERYMEISQISLLTTSLAVLSVFVFILFNANIRPIIANVILTHSLKPTVIDPQTKLVVQNSPKSKFENVQKSIALVTMTNSEQIEQLAERGSELVSSSVITNEHKQSVHKYISDQYTLAFARTPNDPRPYFFYTMYLQRVGLIKEATEVAAKTLTLSPQKQLFLNFYGMLLIQNGEKSKGLEQIKKAYDEDTTNVEGFYSYLSALIQNNMADEAETLSKDNTIKYIQNNSVIEAYIQTDQASRIIELLQKQISLNPNSIELRSTLATVYFRSKNVTAAIATLESIKKIAPQYVSSIDKAIAEIKNAAGIK